MDEFVNNFVAEFQTLQGVTVAERKKTLFQFFNKVASFEQSNVLVDTLTDKLQLLPFTHLEQHFFVEFLIWFRRYKELANELFEKENALVIRRIVKEKWFFEKVASETGIEFITQIVLKVSHALLLKFLKRTAPFFKEEQGDQIFNIVLETYGIWVAKEIITSCSLTKIQETLTTYCVKLSPNQLKLLFDKSPCLIYIYMQEQEKHEGNKQFMDFHSIFQHIAYKNIDIYQDLCLKYDFKVNLSRTNTRRFVLKKKQEIINHPELYVKNLHASSLIRGLGSDFTEVYQKLFPNKIQDSPSAESSRLLKYYPKKYRFNLMVTTYNNIFAKTLDESPHLIDEYILRMIPDPAERERLAKLKTKTDEFEPLQFYTPQNCFAAIKEKINFARDSFERGHHVANLVQSCIISNDYNTLLEVTKFVAERFKNDSMDVQQKFLRVLLWQKCDFNKFTMDHWNEISKILATLKFLNTYDDLNVLYKYIEFLIKLDEPVHDVILSSFKKFDFSQNQLIYIESTNIQKKFLIILIDLTPQLVTSSTSIEILDCKVLGACLKYNMKNLKDIINVSEYPRLVGSVKNVLVNKIKLEESIIISALQVVICSKQATVEVEEVRTLFWDNIQFSNPVIIRWFLSNKPQLFATKLKAFLSFSVKTNKEDLFKDKLIWYRIKCYSHLDIDKNCIDFYSSQLTRAKCNILSHLMSPESFLKMVESHKPKVDETNAQFSVHKALLHGLKNIYSPMTSLPLVMHFCKGDYVPVCISLLSSALYKVPKAHLVNYIEDMTNHEILVLKKMAYICISTVLEKQTVLNYLKDCQFDQSITITFKYFLKNSSEEAWTLFVTKLNTAPNIPPYSSKLIAKVKVPTKYKVQHFEQVWTKFNTTNDKHKNTLLKNVQEQTFLELRPEFLQKVIDVDLFHEEEINKLVSIYVIASPMQGKVNILHGALQKYKASENFSLAEIHKFVTKLLTTYMERTSIDENLINSLVASMENTFSLVDIFEEWVTLNVMKFKGKNPKSLSVSLIDFHNILIERFGETVTIIFGNTVKKLMPHFYKKDPEIYEFYNSLLNQKKSVADVLLLIKILPTDMEPEDKVSSNFFEGILTQLQELNLPIVQIHLNLYFKTHKIAEGVSYYKRVHNFCTNTSSWLCFGARRKIGYYYY